MSKELRSSVIDKTNRSILLLLLVSKTCGVFPVRADSSIFPDNEHTAYALVEEVLVNLCCCLSTIVVQGRHFMTAPIMLNTEYFEMKYMSVCLTGIIS